MKMVIDVKLNFEELLCAKFSFYRKNIGKSFR